MPVSLSLFSSSVSVSLSQTTPVSVYKFFTLYLVCRFMLSCLGYPQCRAVQFFPRSVLEADRHDSCCDTVCGWSVVVTLSCMDFGIRCQGGSLFVWCVCKYGCIKQVQLCYHNHIKYKGISICHNIAAVCLMGMMVLNVISTCGIDTMLVFTILSHCTLSTHTPLTS